MCGLYLHRWACAPGIPRGFSRRSAADAGGPRRGDSPGCRQCPQASAPRASLGFLTRPGAERKLLFLQPVQDGGFRDLLRTSVLALVLLLPVQVPECQHGCAFSSQGTQGWPGGPPSAPGRNMTRLMAPIPLIWTLVSFSGISTPASQFGFVCCCFIPSNSKPVLRN